MSCPQTISAFDTAISIQRASLYGDDVVFMYAAADPRTYEEYGCTMLAWGGASDGETVRKLRDMGVHSTGSMWCLTAGAKELHANADLRDAVARDIEGNPIPVWWLFDVTFEGTPTWFGCTNHPAFRAHVRHRVAREMRGGAPGLHVDDHLGTAHPVAFLGGCFCDYCMREFRNWLKRHGTSSATSAAGVTSWDDFDYRTFIREQLSTDAEYQQRRATLPLHEEFLDCQLQLAAENVRQLGALASEIVKHPITLSANTCLPELPHLAVTPHLTHLVGEVNHRSSNGTADLLEAVLAYRMAEAIGKPLAATAKGQDWALINATGAVNLVKIWIALGYCCGQRLMAPHRQWCYTNEKGSHWYAGPAEALAPMYRFVRANPHLFRDTATVGPLAMHTDLPLKLSTHAGRAALEAALAANDPRPLASGPAWIFPRQTAGGTTIVHVLNLAYALDGDRVLPQYNLKVAVPLEKDDQRITHAIMHSYDAEPIDVTLEKIGDRTALILPELRIWSVIELKV